MVTCGYGNLLSHLFVFNQALCCMLHSGLLPCSLSWCWLCASGNTDKTQNLNHKFAPTAEYSSVQMRERYETEAQHFRGSLHSITTVCPEKHDSCLYSQLNEVDNDQVSFPGFKSQCMIRGFPSVQMSLYFESGVFWKQWVLSAIQQRCIKGTEIWHASSVSHGGVGQCL